MEVSEQNELRTEEWKKRQAMLRASGMTDLEGDVALFQDLLRYAKLADVAYAADEEPGGLVRLELNAVDMKMMLGFAREYKYVKNYLIQHSQHAKNKDQKIMSNVRSVMCSAEQDMPDQWCESPLVDATRVGESVKLN